MSRQYIANTVVKFSILIYISAIYTRPQQKDKKERLVSHERLIILQENQTGCIEAKVIQERYQAFSSDVLTQTNLYFYTYTAYIIINQR